MRPEWFKPGLFVTFNMKTRKIYSNIKLNKKSFGFAINWRATWYSVTVWMLAIIVSGFVILPWYYLVLPFVVFWTTVVYFRNGEKTFQRGIWIALFWFFVVGLLDFLEIVGSQNAFLYVSDSRNWLKYILILLIPVIYGLVQENRYGLRGKKSTRKPLGPRISVSS